MLIASTKAYFVCAYFMGLKFDEAANKIYFLGSFLFVFIFIGLICIWNSFGIILTRIKIIEIRFHQKLVQAIIVIDIFCSSS